MAATMKLFSPVRFPTPHLRCCHVQGLLLFLNIVNIRPPLRSNYRQKRALGARSSPVNKRLPQVASITFKQLDSRNSEQNILEYYGVSKIHFTQPLNKQTAASLVLCSPASPTPALPVVVQSRPRPAFVRRLLARALLYARRARIPSPTMRRP